MKICRVCGEFGELRHLWHDYQGAEWYRCLCCGSDTSTSVYPGEREYNADFERRLIDESGGNEGCDREISSNLAWFDEFADRLPGRDFLDVGCCDGSGMRGMAAKGWAVHGFDVYRPTWLQPHETHVTVAPYFTSGLFRRRFHGVLCREVIEHVENWRDLLVQLKLVTSKVGVLQIQTPRPVDYADKIVYQSAHLQIFSPVALALEFERNGLEVLDRKLWDRGQAYCLRLR